MGETDLRDRLALDRTRLANERTLLSYVRTALALGAGGAGLLKFVETPWSRSSGWALIIGSLLLLPVGLMRFLQVQRELAEMRRKDV
jgi:putative membrane protein